MEMTMQSLARSVLRRVFGRTTIGSLSVRWSDSTTDKIAGFQAGPEASISVADEMGMLRSLVKKGSVGLAESYFDGFWTTEDLAALLEVGARNLDNRTDELLSKKWVHGLRDIWDKRPEQLRSDAIHEMADHYNLGNEFYAMWLDPSMTYSSALYESPDDVLETAQERKYDRLCQLIDLAEGDRVLEIGCGWGGFAEHAASRYGAHVTGLTLSTEHAKYASARLAEAGLTDRTEIKLQDFRHERAMYDKVVSIEMIESVDETNWPPLFHAISRALPPGGKAAIQAITIDERFYESLLKHRDFIKTYIFPGGALPSVPVLKELSVEAGLAWVSANSHGGDYAMTLNEWAKRFEAAWPNIVAQDPVFDEAFHRIWRYYLEYCEAGFRTGRIDGYQILLERPQPPSPLQGGQQRSAATM